MTRVSSPGHISPVTFLIFIVVVATVAATQTVGGSNGPVNEDSKWQAIDYANAWGVEPDEALRRVNLLFELKPTLAAIEEQAEDSLAGVWQIHEPELSMGLRLTSNPSPAVSALIDASPVPFIVSTDAPITLADAIGRMERAQPTLQDALPELMHNYIDVKTGNLVIAVLVENETEKAAATRFRADQAAASLEREIDLPVLIKYSVLPARPVHTYGGTDLSGCTGGFTIENDTEEGILGAQHCSNTQTYNGFGSDGTYSLTFEAETETASSESQWHSNSSHVAPGEFYGSSTSTRRTVDAAATRSSLTVDGTACHRGATTGYSCGSIVTKTDQPSGAGCPISPTACSSTWIIVEGDNLACSGGDSGGPWFFGSTAYGILWAAAFEGTDPGDCLYTLWWSVEYVDELDGGDLEIIVP